jgi:hypothetical protein
MHYLFRLCYKLFNKTEGNNQAAVARSLYFARGLRPRSFLVLESVTIQNLSLNYTECRACSTVASLLIL